MSLLAVVTLQSGAAVPRIQAEQQVWPAQPCLVVAARIAVVVVGMEPAAGAEADIGAAAVEPSVGTSYYL